MLSGWKNLSSLKIVILGKRFKRNKKHMMRAHVEKKIYFLSLIIMVFAKFTKKID